MFSRLRKSPRALGFVFGLLLTALAVTGFVTGEAQGGPAEEILHIYYSSPAKTQVVGSWLLTCWGSRYSNGQRTAYRDTYTTPCF
ncbi:MAG: DUF6289 family protein [Acidobacteriota bacterium]